MAGEASRARKDWTVVGLVSYPHMFSHIFYLVLPPLFPLLKAEFDVSYAALGLVITCFGVAAGLGQTPIGFVVDRFGARPVLIAGTILEAGAVGAIGFATEYWHLLVLYALAGIGHTVYHPADYAIMAAQVSKSRLGRAIGIHSFSGNVGFAIAPIFMVAVAELYDWRAAFIAIGLLGLAFVPVLVAQTQLLSNNAPSRKREPAKPGAARAPASDTSARAGIALLLSAPILMCFAFYVLQGMGFGALRTFLVAAMDALHGTPLAVSNTALSGLLAGAAAGILAGGWLADRIGVRASVAVVTLSFAGAVVALVGAVAMPALVFIVLLTLAGFTQGVFNPFRDLMVRQATPDGAMGKVMGFVSSGMNLAGGLTPLLFGWLMDIGEPRLVFYLAAVFVAIALVTFIGVRARVAPAAAPVSASA